jgi:hypothetical protein
MAVPIIRTKAKRNHTANSLTGESCANAIREKVPSVAKLQHIRTMSKGVAWMGHSGRVDTTLPFDELRRRSLINEAAQAADGAPEPDFSRRIRLSLPTIVW